MTNPVKYVPCETFVQGEDFSDGHGRGLASLAKFSAAVSEKMLSKVGRSIAQYRPTILILEIISRIIIIVSWAAAGIAILYWIVLSTRPVVVPRAVPWPVASSGSSSPAQHRACPRRQLLMGLDVLSRFGCRHAVRHAFPSCFAETVVPSLLCRHPFTDPYPDKWDILDMWLRVCVASQRLRVLLHRARSKSL